MPLSVDLLEASTEYQPQDVFLLNNCILLVNSRSSFSSQCHSPPSMDDTFIILEHHRCGPPDMISFSYYVAWPIEGADHSRTGYDYLTPGFEGNEFKRSSLDCCSTLFSIQSDGSSSLKNEAFMMHASDKFEQLPLCSSGLFF